MNLHITLPNGHDVTVPPLTVAAARRALALYPAEGAAENYLARAERLLVESSILFGPENADIVATLPPLDAQNLTGRVWTDACGFEPTPLAWPPLGCSPPAHAPRQSAVYLLTALDQLAQNLHIHFPLMAQHLDTVPLNAALRASTQFRFPSNVRN